MLYYLENKLDILITIYLLAGSPEDTEETMRETIRYAKHLYPKYCSFTVGTLLIPFPGTDFYNEMKEKNLIEIHDWAQYGFGTSVMKLKISREKMRKVYGKFWPSTYARPVVFFKQFRDLFSRNRFRRAMARNFLPSALQAITFSRLTDYRTTNK